MIEAVAADLQRRIIAGALEPEARLRVETLKDHYDVSATTVREALTRMVALGLVTVEAQRGFRVAPISIEDFRQQSSLRATLETAALREAIAKGGLEWEAGIVAAYHTLSRLEERLTDNRAGLAVEWERANRAFHRALIAACDNEWLFRFRAILLDHSSRYIQLSLRSAPSWRDVSQEHRRLHDAVMARDADAACAATEEHIALTVKAVEREVFGTPG